MNEDDLQVFIDGIIHYFDQMSGERPIVDTPYLKDEEDVVMDFTGVIGISGRSKGAIYFTAMQELLKELIRSTGHDDFSQEMLGDMVGEVANTLSGNARKEFGANFMISVPVVIVGRAGIKMPTSIRTFVIPIIWRANKSYLIVCLE